MEVPAASAEGFPNADQQAHVTLGGGMVVGPDQRGFLDYDGPGAMLAGGFALRLLSDLWVEGRLDAGAFQSATRGTGTLGQLGLGLRYELPLPYRGVVLSPAVFLLGAQTGAYTRPAALGSVRATFQIADWVALGPELSYGRIFHFGKRASSDAGYWMVSAALVFRSDPRPAAPPKPQSPPPSRFRRSLVAPPQDGGSAADPEPPPVIELSVELSNLLDEAVTRRVEVLLVPPVLFVTDRAEPIACGEAALFFALEALQKVEGPIEIEGHADTRGDADYNVQLSQARAEFVRNWLVDHGADPERLQIAAHGEQDNLVPEDASGDDGRRQLNRRVTFRLIREPDYVRRAQRSAAEQDASEPTATTGVGEGPDGNVAPPPAPTPASPAAANAAGTTE